MADKLFMKRNKEGNGKEKKHGRDFQCLVQVRSQSMRNFVLVNMAETKKANLFSHPSMAYGF